MSVVITHFVHPHAVVLMDNHALANPKPTFKESMRESNIRSYEVYLHSWLRNEISSMSIALHQLVDKHAKDGVVFLGCPEPGLRSYANVVAELVAFEIKRLTGKTALIKLDPTASLSLESIIARSAAKEDAAIDYPPPSVKRSKPSKHQREANRRRLSSVGTFV